MKYSIPALIGAASLFSRSAAAYNFDDHDRALQRANDMKDTSPLTDEEAIRHQSMIENGRLKVVTKNLPEVEDASGSTIRALKRKGQAKARKAPKGSAPKGSAPKGGAPKGRTNRGRAKKGAANRNAPPATHRSQPKTSPKPQGRNSHPPPQRTGRNKPPKDTGRHHAYYDDDYYDDYYYASGKGGKGKGGKGQYYDDDWAVDDLVWNDDLFWDDDWLGGGGGGTLNYTYELLEGFQDARGLVAAIPPNPTLPDEFDAGTTYLYNMEPLFGVFYDGFESNSTTGRLVDEADQLGTVSGKCIRTDPHDELDVENYSGRAYCQFVYSFPDDFGFSLDDLTAEGPIQIGAEDIVLVVTGGTGLFRRAVGEITLTPVEPDPLPSIEYSDELDLPASYHMQAYLYLDTDLWTSVI